MVETEVSLHGWATLKELNSVLKKRLQGFF